MYKEKIKIPPKVEINVSPTLIVIKGPLGTKKITKHTSFICKLSKNNTLRLTLVNLLSNVLVIVYLSSINTTTLLTIIYSLIIPSLTMFLYLFSIKFIVK